MKLLTNTLLIFFSSIVFGQIDLKTGDQIKAGNLILTNGEIISFYSLEYGADERISYVNTQNLETEFLYVHSVKSIDPIDISAEKILEIENKLKGEQKTVSETFTTITYQDKSIELKNPQPGKSVVYFVRTNSSGNLINFRHFDYDKFIGKFSGEGYLRYECDPGKHGFWVGASNSSYVTAELEAGKIYVIETIPVMGMAYARVKIEIPNRLNAKKYSSQKKRIFKTLSKESNDKSPSPEDLVNQSDYKKEIENGVEKYHDWVEKKHDHLLNTDQYFE